MDLVCPQLIALLVQYERVKGGGWATNFLLLLAFTACLGAPYRTTYSQYRALKRYLESF
ncbi:hypothetical protein RND59_00325 [Vibrio ruber]|uniref:hypothetical protein n=1 Tax=Vibrio ruber TaxID=184755 RepID=UPI002892CBFD|nr:hypothetical protein [Vibrio ruber]WNJ95602.1 hypothetical protein RND59_00325 [Vibrio ruber]